jgi:hypothetical protein
MLEIRWVGDVGVIVPVERDGTVEGGSEKEFRDVRRDTGVGPGG